jgi:hypothetical protein
MAWTTPKTNWKATDTFEIGDYARIVGNITYLHGLADKMFYLPPLNVVPATKTYSDMIYPAELNAIENNVVLIDTATYKTGYQATVWKANQPTPTYEDYNRIESEISELKSKLQAQYDKAWVLPITLG